MSDELAGVKALQRAIWSAGDYDAIAELFWDVGAVVAEAAAIEAGMKVLDVATGTGNAAIRAAVAGADVVGLDLTPELSDDARLRSGATRTTCARCWTGGRRCRSSAGPPTSSGRRSTA